jgi:hypothetical protein
VEQVTSPEGQLERSDHDQQQEQLLATEFGGGWIGAALNEPQAVQQVR